MTNTKVKVAVVYSSLTGNTKKFAQKIAQSLEADLFRVSDAPAPGRYDLVFVGSGTYMNMPHPAIKKYILKHEWNGTKVAGFMTYHHYQDSLKFMEALFMDRGAQIVGMWGTPSKAFYVFNPKKGLEDRSASIVIFAQSTLKKAVG